jgi:hypothetical protein
MRGTQLRRGTFLLLLAVAVAASSSAVALVLAGEGRVAGLALALSGGVLLASGVGTSLSPRLLLLEAVTERALEAAVLGAIAWVGLPEMPRLTGAAVTAMGAAYLAAYLRVRGMGLGFRVTVPAAFRTGPLFLVALGLVAGKVEVALWAVVVLSVSVLAVEVAELARQRELR